MKWFIVVLMMINHEPQTFIVDAGPWASERQCEIWLMAHNMDQAKQHTYCTKIGDL